MRTLRNVVVAAAALLLAGTAGNGAGFNGSFDGLADSISGLVAEGDPSAVKINNFIQQTSTTRSKDFGTLSKVAKEAAKSGFTVVSEEDLSLLLNTMVADTEAFGLSALQRVLEAAAGDPLHAARILKKNALYLAKKDKAFLKYQSQLTSEDPDLSKAARFYAAVAKLYESIDRAFPPIG